MRNHLQDNDIFGFVKPLVDVHTMGVYSFAALLRECGYRVVIAPDEVNEAVQDIRKINNYGLLKKWVLDNRLTRLGFSYRLDPQEGCDYFMSMLQHLKDDNQMEAQGGNIKQVFFAGLPDTCLLVRGKTNGEILTFPGDETPVMSLTMIGVPKSKLPKELHEVNEYDRMRWDFAKDYIASERYKKVMAQDHYGYPECGSDKDSYLLRLNYARGKHALPIIRTHSGPYNPNRDEALKEYNSWCRTLASTRLLDVLSIGSSQLTQSNFGENWEGKPNGGGVPVNSALEYRVIKENALPMLVRTYSGTKNVPELARIHEQALNISWHALSFWWFDELDGRGSNSLLANLKEHFEAVRYIVTTGKPVEPNVPHHFAFRGADDISYIISGYLAAKACKRMGVQHLILQNMLNTPKYTTGIQDLAKGRTMIRLVRELEDENFKVSLQSRAGLDYFAPDLEQAKIQLASVTCMMDDLEPENNDSPEIIHVVNYSEAVRLATPPIIKESIQITLGVLKEYRVARMLDKVPNMKYNRDVEARAEALYAEAKESISLLENAIPNLYTPEGFYKVFVEGFLPVPYLMDQHRKFKKATQWHTVLKNGGICVVNEEGTVINTVDRYRKIIGQMG